MLLTKPRSGEICFECGELILGDDLVIQHFGAETLILHFDCARHLEQELAKDLEEAYKFIAGQNE